MSTSPVTVISQALAHQFFPNQDSLGKKLSFGFPPDGSAAREIVGIVGDVRDVALGENPRPMMYVPYAQAPFPGLIVVVRSALSTASIAAGIRRSVEKIDQDLAGYQRDQDGGMQWKLPVEQPRFRTFLLTLFAAMALVLAATGIFGVVSYSVSCRTPWKLECEFALGGFARGDYRDGVA